MATIYDVARRAEVSVKTVSRALNSFSGIREETKTRIERAMDELDYHPSAAARSLRGRGTDIVAVVADNLTVAPDSFEIVKGVQSVCATRGKLLMIGEMKGRRHGLKLWIRNFLRQRAEAILVVTLAHRHIDVQQCSRNSPLVLINCFSDSARHSCVVPDDEGGAFSLATALLRQGHRRIAHLGLPPDMMAARLRAAGYRDAHRRFGLPVDERLIVSGFSQHADELHDLPRVLDALLSLSPPPTALMCGNDKMAMRALMLLRAGGVRVPEDISLAGFDDYRMLSQGLIPSLSTVALPYFDMGATGAAMALDGVTPQRVVMPCPLVLRDSTAPYRGSASDLARIARPPQPESA